MYFFLSPGSIKVTGEVIFTGTASEADLIHQNAPTFLTSLHGISSVTSHGAGIPASKLK